MFIRNVLSASTIQHHQQQQQLYHQSHNVGNKQLIRPLTSGNIAAIEPYHHVPLVTAKNQQGDLEEFQKQQLHPARQHPFQIRNEMKIERDNKEPPYLNRRLHPSETDITDHQIYNHERFSVQDDFNMKMVTNVNKNSVSSTGNQNYSPVDEGYNMKDDKSDVVEVLPEFGASKSDPKYQTLPYNTKFTVNYVTQPSLGLRNINTQSRRPAGEGIENITTESTESAKNNNNSVNHLNNNVNQQQLMNVVHSIPIPTGANKGLATPLANQNNNKPNPTISSSASSSSSSSSFSVLGNLGPR